MNEKNMPCAYWREGEICAKGTEPGYTDFCVLGPCSQMKPSNADKIRQMSDEELAKEIAWLIVEAMKQLHPFSTWKASDEKMIQGTADELLDWLKQEAPDETD